ncbi:unnamed protein product [Symbiodinium sp. CCMP2592]|nr:unnamed protein product [Symbiodinium sp. CCMP2592]
MARPLVALLLVTCGKVCALSIAGFVQDQCFLERAHSVAISGNFAYVGGYHPESGLTVMDISDPSRLVVVGGLFHRYLTYPREIVIVGNYAYVLVGGGIQQGLTVVNIADPGNLTVAGFIEVRGQTFPNTVSFLAIDGNYAYLSGTTTDMFGGVPDPFGGFSPPPNRGKLVVLNIEDVSNITIAGSMDVDYTNGAHGVATGQGYAYVAVGAASDTGTSPSGSPGSFQAINISDPNNLAVAGSVQDSALIGAGSVAILGDIAYVVVANGLTAVNISNPGSMTITGSIQNSMYFKGAFDIEIVGDIAFVVGHNLVSSSPGVYQGVLTAVNISNPSSLSIADSIQNSVQLNGAHGVAVSGDYAYVAAVHNDGLAVVNVSDTLNLALTGAFEDSNSPFSALDGVSDVAVTADFAFVVGKSHHSFAVVNITDLRSMTIAGAIQDPVRLEEATSVAIGGNYAFVTSSQNFSLTAINIEDPSHPVIVSSVHDYQLVLASEVALHGNFAVVRSSRGLTTINVTDPTNLEIVGQIPLDVRSELLGDVRGLTISGDYAYVTNSRGLAVVNISDPVGNLSILGSVPDDEDPNNLLSQPGAVAISENFAYVAVNTNNARGLVVVNITNPEGNLSIASFISDPRLFGATKVAITGNYAIVGLTDVNTLYDDEAGLAVVDISDLNNLTVIEVIRDYGRFTGLNGVNIFGGYAWATASDADGVVLVALGTGAALVKKRIAR